MTASNTRRLIQRIRSGEPITARYLSSLADAINQNTKAISAPKQRFPQDALDPSENPASVPPTGLVDLTFTSTSITNETVTITDSNGDTHDIERITQVTFDNSAGDTLTLNLSY